jgi:hypothetical protein
VQTRHDPGPLRVGLVVGSIVDPFWGIQGAQFPVSNVERTMGASASFTDASGALPSATVPASSIATPSGAASNTVPHAAPTSPARTAALDAPIS